MLCAPFSSACAHFGSARTKKPRHQEDEQTMAKRKTSGEKAGRRQRRSIDERVADLQAKIDQLKRRAEAASAKKDPHMKKALTILRALDRALGAANDAGHEVRHGLAAARKPLGDYLENQGIRLPKASLPRGRKPKSLTG
jgi:molecular chaperone GrpE (heat shock protein)